MLKKEAKALIAQSSQVILWNSSNIPTVKTDRSRVGWLKQTKVTKKEIPARAVRAVELTERCRRKSERNILYGCVLALIPVRSMAAKVSAGENRIHFRK